MARRKVETSAGAEGVTKPRTAEVLTYTNRLGDTYFLHQGTTKTGKPRYFIAKAIGAGALSEMPSGYEFAESINGVVSVRRVAPSLIPDADVESARAEVRRHVHLCAHRVEIRGREIIIHEPDRLLEPTGFAGPALARGLFGEHQRALAERFQAEGSYSPVMKFVLSDSEDDGWTAYRMSYRGKGGWWMLSSGPLAKLVKQFVRHVGTEDFFELV